MDLFTIDSLQEYLKIGKSTLYRLIKHDRDFPSPVWIGERRRYRKADINRWIYQQKQQLPDSLPMEIDLLDSSAARDVLNISYATFHRLTKEDRSFPAPLLIAGKKLFDKIDITNWLNLQGLKK